MVGGRAATIGVLVLAALPAAAQAHSEILVDQRGEVTYLSADATSLNTLEVRLRGAEVELRDASVDGGIQFGECRPGEVDEDGYVIQAFCPYRAGSGIRIDLGEREDTMVAEVPFSVQALGGPGADELRGGPAGDIFQGGDGNDELVGAGGADVLLGGLGADTVDGGDGDDDVRVADGVADTIRCGAGTDRVDADQADVLPADAGCETVTRSQVEPPPGAAASGDTAAPRVRTDARSRQPLRDGRVRVGAKLSEPGAVAASGFLEVGGVRTVLQAKRRTIARVSGRAVLTARLSRAQRRAAGRAKRRGRRVVVRLQVVGTDAAGNSSKPRTVVVRLV